MPQVFFWISYFSARTILHVFGYGRCRNEVGCDDCDIPVSIWISLASFWSILASFWPILTSWPISAFHLTYIFRPPSDLLFFLKHNFCVKPYVPREPWRDPSNRRLNKHGIYILPTSILTFLTYFGLLLTYFGLLNNTSLFLNLGRLLLNKANFLLIKGSWPSSEPPIWMLYIKLIWFHIEYK